MFDNLKDLFASIFVVALEGSERNHEPVSRGTKRTNLSSVTA